MAAIRVVAALLQRDDRVLMYERPRNGTRGGLWEFPGGKVEAGETDEAALVRECHEELSLAIVVGAQVWAGEYSYPDLQVDLHVYEAWIMGGKATALEGGAVLWVELAKLLDRPLSPADIEVAHKLVRGELPRTRRENP